MHEIQLELPLCAGTCGTRSDYAFGFYGRRVLVIIDLNLGRMSVTNDAERVIEEIALSVHNIHTYRIVYRDSEMNCDLMYLRHDGTIGFLWLHMSQLSAACRWAEKAKRGVIKDKDARLDWPR